MFVCVCNAVTDHQIIDAIDEGLSSFDALQETLCVGNTCGSCSCEVKKLLQGRIKETMSRQQNLSVTSGVSLQR